MSKRDLTGEEGYRRFEEFLDEWSRRDFLRAMGAGTAFTLFATEAWSCWPPAAVAEGAEASRARPRGVATWSRRRSPTCNT